MSDRAIPKITEQGDRKRRLGMGVIALVVLGLSAVGTAHVAVHAKRIEAAIELGKAQNQHRELMERQRHLEIERGMLKDPRRLTQLAKTELGMGPVDPNNIRTVRYKAVAR